MTRQVFSFERDGKTYYYAASSEYDSNHIIFKDNKFYYKEKCPKCEGRGEIGRFMNVRNGVCFLCKGVGYTLTRIYTAMNKSTIENKIAKAEEAAKISYQEECLKNMLKTYGEDFYMILDTKEKSTYKHKEELKQQGCRWNSWIRVWTNTKPIEGFYCIPIHTRDYLDENNIIKYEVIEKMVKEHNNSLKESVCPNCGKTFTEPPAISRKDNKTEICSDCGQAEAIQALINHSK